MQQKNPRKTILSKALTAKLLYFHSNNYFSSQPNNSVQKDSNHRVDCNKIEALPVNCKAI